MVSDGTRGYGEPKSVSSKLGHSIFGCEQILFGTILRLVVAPQEDHPILCHDVKGFHVLQDVS